MYVHKHLRIVMSTKTTIKPLYCTMQTQVHPPTTPTHNMCKQQQWNTNKRGQPMQTCRCQNIVILGVCLIIERMPKSRHITFRVCCRSTAGGGGTVGGLHTFICWSSKSNPKCLGVMLNIERRNRHHRPFATHRACPTPLYTETIHTL